MRVNYSDQKLLKSSDGSIFLAGPTPRQDSSVPSWRIRGLESLKRYGFKGLVYVPEASDWKSPPACLDKQFWWEREALAQADIIVFWLERYLDPQLKSLGLPGFTTNVEFGYCLALKRLVIYGRPDDARKIGYLDRLYRAETGYEPINDLSKLLKVAVDLVG